jgi:ComEC/Rec2-related protein
MRRGLRVVGQVREAFEALAGQLRRQPLLLGAALFLAGVVAGYRFVRWPLAAAGAVLCAAVLLWRRQGSGARGARAAALITLLVLAGWSRSAWDQAGRRDEADRLGDREPRQTFLCRVGADVAVTPVRGEAAKYTFRAERVKAVGDGDPLPIRYLPVVVNWYGAYSVSGTNAPQAGAVWRVSGRAKVQKGRDGLPALTLNTGEDRAERVLDADSGSWLVRAAQARRVAARRVTVGIESWGVVPQLNQAMMLGCRSEIPADMRRVFSNSGTIHVFAISGLNIALVAGLLIVVVSALGVPRPYWVLGVAPLLIFYTLASGAQPSAVRACVMAIIYFAAPLFGRRPSGLAALAGTALLVYALAPWLVYSIGCTLSFAVMGGLVVFCKPFCTVGRTLCRLPLLEQRACLYAKAGNAAAAARLLGLRTAARFMIDSVAVSLAAWLASLPLSAYYFGRFTPGGFFANLVIAPCAFLVMVAGSLGLVASFVSDWLASCFNHAAGFFTLVMIKTAELTVSFEWANFRIPKWEPWLVWLWFAVLAGCAFWLRLRRPADGMEWLEPGDGGWGR